MIGLNNRTGLDWIIINFTGNRKEWPSKCFSFTFRTKKIEPMKKLMAITTAVVLMASSQNVNAQKRYSRSKHSSSHGGTYKGGSGSSHKGGSYKNSSTGNRYGKHK